MWNETAISCKILRKDFDKLFTNNWLTNQLEKSMIDLELYVEGYSFLTNGQSWGNYGNVLVVLVNYIELYVLKKGTAGARNQTQTTPCCIEGVIKIETGKISYFL